MEVPFPPEVQARLFEVGAMDSVLSSILTRAGRCEEIRQTYGKARQVP
jgi:hypothetical protein